MTKSFVYRTKGVCSSAIHITLEDDIISEVKYDGGCSGNTQGISVLVQGMRVADAISRLKGIRCGFKSTSCPDQLAQALEKIAAEQKAN